MWPFNTGDWLIEVITWGGLTVDTSEIVSLRPQSRKVKYG
jgi:hypothetical protein